MKTTRTIKNLLFAGVISLSLASCGGGGGGGSSTGSSSSSGSGSNTQGTVNNAPETLTAGMEFHFTNADNDYKLRITDSSSAYHEDWGDVSYTYSPSGANTGTITVDVNFGEYSWKETFILTFKDWTSGTCEWSDTDGESESLNFSISNREAAPVQPEDNGSSGTDSVSGYAPETLEKLILTIKDSPVFENGESFIFLSDSSALYGGQIKSTYSYKKDANNPNKGFLESTIEYGGYTYIHKLTITFLSETEATVSGSYNAGSDTRYYYDVAATFAGDSNTDSSVDSPSSGDNGNDITNNNTEQEQKGTAPDSLTGYVIHAETYTGSRRYYITGESEVYIKASYRNTMSGYYSGEQYIFGTLSYSPSEDRKTAKIYISTPEQWIGSTYPYGGQMAGFQHERTYLSGTVYFDDNGNIKRIEGDMDYETLNPSESVGVYAVE